MSLLMQFKFQSVTKYVRPYGTALYCFIVIPSQVTGSFTLRAKCTPRYTRLKCITRNECCYSPRAVYTYVINLQCAREHVANISMLVQCARGCTRVRS